MGYGGGGGARGGGPQSQALRLVQKSLHTLSHLPGQVKLFIKAK